MKTNSFTYNVGGKCVIQFDCAEIYILIFLKFNKATKVLTTCLWNCQKPLLSLTSLWFKIWENWQHWYKKTRQTTSACMQRGIINYFSCKCRRNLTGNSCTRPSLDRQKMTVAEFCVQFFHYSMSMISFDIIW